MKSQAVKSADEKQECREDVAQKPSGTELALREFLERVSEMEGVTVRRFGGDTIAEQTIVVEVPSILSPEARAVVRLQGDMYAKYPGASVRVHVNEANGKMKR